jgi:hypothetical protein
MLACYAVLELRSEIEIKGSRGPRRRIGMIGAIVNKSVHIVATVNFALSLDDAVKSRKHSSASSRGVRLHKLRYRHLCEVLETFS